MQNPDRRPLPNGWTEHYDASYVPTTFFLLNAFQHFFTRRNNWFALLIQSALHILTR